MNEVDSLIQALSEKKKLVAMLAPSFPIVFSYPSIIVMLRKLGFSYVVEVSLGAEKTNAELAELLKNNPSNRYITSPCPTIVEPIVRVHNQRPRVRIFILARTRELPNSPARYPAKTRARKTKLLPSTRLAFQVR